MWNLGSLTRYRTHTPCTGRQTLNHWTTREVPSIFVFISLTFLLSFAGHIYLLLFSTISFLCSYNLALGSCFIKEIVSLFYLHSWWNIWWPFFVWWYLFFFFPSECSLYLLPSFYLDGIFVQIRYLFLHRLQPFLGPVIYGRFELGRCQGHVPGQLAFPHNLVLSGASLLLCSQWRWLWGPLSLPPDPTSAQSLLEALSCI